MGLLGWLARRLLAAWIWAPLVGLWFVVFTLASGISPAVAPMSGPVAQRAAVLAVIFGTITDWLIMRRVKRAMQRRAQQNRPPQPR